MCDYRYNNKSDTYTVWNGVSSRYHYHQHFHKVIVFTPTVNISIRFTIFAQSK